MQEIERKFLVKNDRFKTLATAKKEIAQGYLNTNPERTVRVRISNEKAFLTIKGKGNESGMTRFEWEKEIPLEEGKALLLLCEKGVIEKTRFEIPDGKHLFEVDEFYGENEGLIVAEIELSDENEAFEKPDWLGIEVTNDERYYNAYLSKNPFSEWNEKV
ncbi:CYTH domain-containing protein [Flavobacterium antarcticum]|uniref:CYTH domain-containing protein n=1 Tax=Flavobacterium antarcticum TaxID=271155 RepID=UPI0003B658EC|nr:CYTH domain-containing protein [Flavobacterium antarcticum]